MVTGAARRQPSRRRLLWRVLGRRYWDCGYMSIAQWRLRRALQVAISLYIVVSAGALCRALDGCWGGMIAYSSISRIMCVS